MPYVYPPCLNHDSGAGSGSASAIPAADGKTVQEKLDELEKEIQNLKGSHKAQAE